jgi:hypothetical protein
MQTIERTKTKRQTAFRLDNALLERLRIKAKLEHRSLNNYVETILYSVAYDEPNELTLKAMKEAMEEKNLETLDLDKIK